MNLRLLWTGCDYLEAVAIKQVEDFPVAPEMWQHYKKQFAGVVGVIRRASTGSLFLCIEGEDIALCLTKRKYEV